MPRHKTLSLEDGSAKDATAVPTGAELGRAKALYTHNVAERVVTASFGVHIAALISLCDES